MPDLGDMHGHAGHRDGSANPTRRSSRAWYLLPICFFFFGGFTTHLVGDTVFGHLLYTVFVFLGGILSYLLLSNRDSSRARRTLALGMILAIFYAIIAAVSLLAGPFDDDIDRGDANIVAQVPQDIDDTAQAPAVVHSVISYNDVPYYANKEAAMGALKLAVFAWEQDNPSLDFEIAKDADGDVHVRWVREFDGNTIGLWRHVDMETAGNVDYVLIELGRYCDSRYQLYSQGFLTYVIAHELGHHLRLGHVDDPEHLMFPGSSHSSAPDASSYDTRGYEVPDLQLVPMVCP